MLKKYQKMLIWITYIVSVSIIMTVGINIVLAMLMVFPIMISQMMIFATINLVVRGGRKK